MARKSVHTRFVQKLSYSPHVRQVWHKDSHRIDEIIKYKIKKYSGPCKEIYNRDKKTPLPANLQKYNTT